MMRVPAFRRSLNLGVIAVFSVSRILQFAMTFVVAQTMTVYQAGIVFYILGLIVLLQSLTSLGLENYGNYMFPRRKRRGHLYKMWGYIFLLFGFAIPLSFLGALTIYTFPEIAQMSIAPLIVLVVAISSAMGAFRRLVRLIFVGLGQRARALVHESLIYYTALIGLVLVAKIDSTGSMAIALVISSLVSFIFALWDIRRALPSPPRGFMSEMPRLRNTRATTCGALPSFISQSAPLLLNRADVLLLAPLASASEVALYAVAIRVTFLLSTVIDLSMVVWGSKLMDVGNLRPTELRTLIIKVFTVTAVVALVVCVPIIFLTGPLLAFLFGEGYAEASRVLIVLLIGKMLTAPFQPLLISLVSLGKNRALARILSLAAVTSIGLNLIFIPIWGAVGCAVASSCALAIMAIGYALLLSELVWSRPKSE